MTDVVSAFFLNWKINEDQFGFRRSHLAVEITIVLEPRTFSAFFNGEMELIGSLKGQ